MAHYATKSCSWMFSNNLELQKKIIFTLSFLLFVPSFSQPQEYSDQDCLFCHGKPEIAQITSDGKVRSLYVDREEWSQDIHHHGKLTCVDCHKNAKPYLHFREGFIDVDCARCHPEEAEEYQKNIHLTFTVITPGKELPLCHHCHTKHRVLRHDDSSSSVHESNLADTCGECHPEVMAKELVKGTSLGKISGHRKGDLSDPFDMRVCISCHYQDSAHGTKRVYKDFCTRCHDIRSKGDLVMGPLHLNSTRWAGLNLIGNGLFFLFLVAIGSFILFQSRRNILGGMRAWFERMKKEIKDTAMDTIEDQTPKDREKNQDNHGS